MQECFSCPVSSHRATVCRCAELFRHVARNGFFRSFSVFIDRQLPPDVGYPAVMGHDSNMVMMSTGRRRFDPDEVVRSIPHLVRSLAKPLTHTVKLFSALQQDEAVRVCFDVGSLFHYITVAHASRLLQFVCLPRVVLILFGICTQNIYLIPSTVKSQRKICCDGSVMISRLLDDLVQSHTTFRCWGNWLISNAFNEFCLYPLS